MSMINDSVITAENVDLTNCDREQIQYAGAIQPHGVILAVSEPELRILQVSQNSGEVLGVDAKDLVGAELSRLFSAEQLERTREFLSREKLDGSPVHFSRETIAGREFDVLAHRYDQVLVLEMEVRTSSGEVPLADLYSDLRGVLAKLQATTGLQTFFEVAVRHIQDFTGFDRVMVYKFMDDGSGWVRSEALRDGMEPYLGLHYPPSDIPAPARRMYGLTWLRHNPDIAYRPVPLVPENNPKTGGPLDMSYAFLRSVSVMYVDYLKNMGSQSTMVMTLFKEGKLWGLIACHHHTSPKHVPYETRVACEFLAHMVSMLMSAKEDLETYQYRMKLKAAQTRLVENVSRRKDFAAGFLEDEPNLLQFVNCEGAAVVVSGHIHVLGSTPSEAEIKRIVKWLSLNVNQDVYATDCLSAQLPEAEAFKETCAGLLSVRFSKAKDDFLLWFRPEIMQSVRWAGDPNKPMNVSDDGQRLLPRTSFALWKETVHLKSAPWEEIELEAATQLRASLLELVLRRADEIGRLYADLERSYADLDSFSYVASHDLKEPLRGIHNYAEMLQETCADKLDDESKAKLATLGRLSKRMDELIDSLLEYSRVGRMEFSHREVDLNGVVHEAIDMLETRIQQEKATVKLLQPLPVVKGDPMRLMEVFTNLISNAIKYNDKADKLVEVGFVEDTSKTPTFFVRDNGIGIEERHQAQIFQIFRRLHGRDQYGGGSGAGLTITRKLIDRHGGKIWVESTPGRGTTFFFVLGPAVAGVAA